MVAVAVVTAENYGLVQDVEAESLVVPKGCVGTRMKCRGTSALDHYC